MGARLFLSSFFRHVLKNCPVLLTVFLLGIGVAWAQESEIRGLVTDETGGVIPGVAVTATYLTTQTSRETITRDDGSYSIPLLKEGEYLVVCSLDGFATGQSTIDIDFRQEAQLDFQLKVGQISEVVEVEATTARLQTKAQDVGTTIEEKQIHELPLNGRNYLDLAKLGTGILLGKQGTRGEQTGEEGGFRSGGLPFDQTAILVDGVDNASRVVRGPMITQAQQMKPAVEAISEFKVITNNVSAEYGYKAGAQVLVSTKGGTNSLHGAVYEFHRNGALAANNFMFNRDAPRDPDTGEITEDRVPYIRNQFGGVLGGPIIKDKTFFFFSYQGSRMRTGGGSFLRGVPSPLARQGDFSQELDIGNMNSNVYDPLTLTGTGATAERQQFPDNIIPQDRWDASGREVLALFPQSNLPGQEFERWNYFSVQKNFNDNDVFDVRIDHNFNDNHRLFGRWSYRNETGAIGGQLPFPAAPSNWALYKGQQVALNYNATLSPTRHNELRLGITHFPASRGDEHTEDLNQRYGIKNSAAEQYPDLLPAHFTNGGFVRFYFGGGNRLNQLGGTSLTNTTTLDTFYMADNFFISLGDHSLKFGGEHRRDRGDISQGNAYGTMSFDGRYTAQFPNVGASRGSTGATFADSLLGWSSSLGTGLPGGEDLINPYWGFYVQDDWRVTPRLTINLGLRYELFLGPNHANPGNEANQSAKSVFSGNIYDETLDTLDIRFERWEFPKGKGDCGCIVDKNNWAPRIGIAYRLTDSTVIRAGAGMYYSQNGSVSWNSNRYPAQGPSITGAQLNGNFEIPGGLTVDGFPDLDLIQGDPTILAVNAVDWKPDLLRQTSSGQWFLDIQHQFPHNILVTLGYNGNAQSNIPWWQRRPTAPLTPSTVSVVNRLRSPAPEDLNSTIPLRFLLLTDNNLNANYNAFTAKVEKRFSRGFSFLNSFTWGKAMDFGVSSLNERGESIGAWNSGQPPSQHMKDLWRNYGRAGLNRTLAYALSTLYELPAGPGKGRLDSGPASWILGGWQLGGIFTAQTGPSISHNMLVDTQQMEGPYRGEVIRNPNLPKSERDSMNWFDESAIVQGEPGTMGSAGRGIIFAPGWVNLDLLLSKNFPMPWEGHRIQFRFEAFNFTNTSHLGPPSSRAGAINQTLIGTGRAGRILSASDPRIIQVALKYVF